MLCCIWRSGHIKYVWSPISGNSEINPPIDIHLHKAEGFFCISPNGINSMELLRIT